MCSYHASRLLVPTSTLDMNNASGYAAAYAAGYSNTGNTNGTSNSQESKKRTGRFLYDWSFHGAALTSIEGMNN